jgi:hypothetical protein
MKRIFCCMIAGAWALGAYAQNDPATTELWKPVPPKVTPSTQPGGAPSDAIVLFDGSNLNAWESLDGKPAPWDVKEGAMTVKAKAGNIRSRQSFGDCQLHIEWRSPLMEGKEGQARANSGVFLMGIYEVQVLDNYENKTYVNGQAASIYKQYPPLVNACRKPGEWQTYDIFFKAPRFSEKGSPISPAVVTVVHNGVLVQNGVSLWGPSMYIGLPTYTAHPAKLPLQLQDHGDPVSFRNIWIREL